MIEDRAADAEYQAELWKAILYATRKTGLVMDQYSYLKASEADRLAYDIALQECSDASPSDIKLSTVWVPMRDGTRLATDLYLPPVGRAPAVAVRTPYGRNTDDNAFLAGLLCLARRGYAVVSQDCRGTGSSEPDRWDYYMFESEDGYDLIEWVTRQDWFGGFIGSCGGAFLNP